MTEQPEITVYCEAIVVDSKLALVMTNSYNDDCSVQILEGEFPQDDE